MNCKERFVVFAPLIPNFKTNVLQVGALSIRKVSTVPPNECVNLVEYCRWAEAEGFGVYDTVVTTHKLFCDAWLSLQDMKQ